MFSLLGKLQRNDRPRRHAVKKIDVFKFGHIQEERRAFLSLFSNRKMDLSYFNETNSIN